MHRDRQSCDWSAPIGGNGLELYTCRNPRSSKASAAVRHGQSASFEAALLTSLRPCACVCRQVIQVQGVLGRVGWSAVVRATGRTGANLQVHPPGRRSRYFELERLVCAPVSGLILNGVLPTVTNCGEIFHSVRGRRRSSGRRSPPTQGDTVCLPVQVPKSSRLGIGILVQFIPLPGHPPCGRQGTQAPRQRYPGCRYSPWL